MSGWSGTAADGEPEPRRARSLLDTYLPWTGASVGGGRERLDSAGMEIVRFSGLGRFGGGGWKPKGRAGAGAGAGAGSGAGSGSSSEEFE